MTFIVGLARIAGRLSSGGFCCGRLSLGSWLCQIYIFLVVSWNYVLITLSILRPSSLCAFQLTLEFVSQWLLKMFSSDAPELFNIFLGLLFSCTLELAVQWFH